MTRDYQSILRQRRAVQGALLLFQRTRFKDRATGEYWLSRAAYYMTHELGIDELLDMTTTTQKTRPGRIDYAI